MTEENARRILLGSTRGLKPAEVAAAVDRMVTLGECSWHAASMVCGTKCCCANCTPGVKRFA
jgi:hypothetical protein